MIWSQDDLIFPVSSVPEAGPLPPGGKRVRFDLAGGETLHGAHIAPSSPPDGERILILGFGGNGWNGEDVGSYLHQVYPQADIVAFHYRGYRPSTGKPSAEALLADAPLVLQFARDLVPHDRCVAVGLSIGSAIAAALAGRGLVDGAILVTPFDSLRKVASDQYPWLPVGMLFRHELNAVELLGDSATPLAVIAAADDEIIPTARTDALRLAIGAPAFDRTIDDAGHNDIYRRSDFQQAMDEALAAVLAA